MYGIFTYIYHKDQPNVGEYTSHMDGMDHKFPSFEKVGTSDHCDYVKSRSARFWCSFSFVREKILDDLGVFAELDIGNT